MCTLMCMFNCSALTPRGNHSESIEKPHQPISSHHRDLSPATSRNKPTLRWGQATAVTDRVSWVTCWSDQPIARSPEVDPAQSEKQLDARRTNYQPASLRVKPKMFWLKCAAAGIQAEYVCLHKETTTQRQHSHYWLHNHKNHLWKIMFWTCSPQPGLQRSWLRAASGSQPL